MSYGRNIFISIFILHFTAMDRAAAATNSTRLTVGGVILPVFTPFNDDYTINFDMIPKYAKHIVKMNFKGIIVGGTTGEHMTLTVEERRRLLETWVNVAKELDLKIIAQVGGGPLLNVLHLAKDAEMLGVAAILTLPELYYRPNTVEQLVDYVNLVSEAAPNTPILYYHHPTKSNVLLPMTEFVKAATLRIPNFKGIKFTSSNLSEAYSTLKSLREGQEVFLASPTVIAGAATLGFKSMTAGSFNIFPKQSQEIMAAVFLRDTSTAQNIQEKISKVIQAIGQEERIPKLKALMKIVSGLDMGAPRLPMRSASKEDVQKLAEVMKEVGFLNRNERHHESPHTN